MLRRVPVVAEWWEDAIIYISRQIQLLSNVPVVTVASRTFAMRCSVAKKGSVATLLSGLSTANRFACNTFSTFQMFCAFVGN